MEIKFYIDIALLCISLMMTIIFGLAWKTMERTPHALTWSLAFFFFALRVLVGFFAYPFPTIVVTILTSMLTLTSLGLGLYGWRQRANLSTNLYLYSGYFAVYFVLVILSVTVFPHVGVYYALLPICAATVFVMDCIVISGVKRKLRISEQCIIVVYLVFACIELVAAVVAFLQGAEKDPYYFNLYIKINFIFMPAAFTGMGLFAALILVDDLSFKMKNLAATDVLTGLINRRGFEKALRLILDLSKRSGETVHIVLADLDHFKSINDSYGHAAGDSALKEFSDILKANLRAGDIVGRIGGEEFAFLFPSTDRETALKIVERIRVLTSNHRIIHGKHEFSVTASFGLAPLDSALTSFDDIFAEADTALYRAKSEGRNRVELAGAPESTPA